MENKEIIINRLPSITWHRLKINEGRVNCPDEVESTNVDIVCPEEFSYNHSSSLSDIATGAGAEFKNWMESRNITTHAFVLSKETKANDPLRLSFVAEPTQSAVAIELLAEENTQATLIMDYTAKENAQFLAVQTKIRAKKGAKIKLVQMQRIDQKITFINDFGADLSEHADLHLIQLILNGEKSFDGCKVILAGEGANFDASLGYTLKNSQKLDINYVVEHKGIASSCDIQVNGVLRDQSEKVFRGTIDLQRGASKSVGTEKEDVLMIDDGVVNKSLPVILCDEEDVEGNHGATMGRLNEDLLFYIKSRGIPQEEVYELMSRARIEEIAQKIEDVQARNTVLEYIGGDTDED